MNDRAQFRPLDFHDIAAYDALGFDIKLGEPAEDRCAGLCQSLAHGAAQLAFATNWWAMANGYRPRKVEPPSASALAPSLLLPGCDVTAETALRLTRARIEILVPWEGVLGAIGRKAKRTGQSVLDFPRVAPAAPAPAAPVAPAAPTNNATCHYRRCSAVVLDAAGHPLPGQGVKAGKSVYCTPHAAQHLTTLKRKRDARRAKHNASADVQ